MADATVAAPKKSGAGKIVLVVIVLLIGYWIYKSAGGAAAPTTPDGVVERMERNMAGLESAEFAGTLSANVEGTKNPLASIPGATTGEAANAWSFALGFSGTSEFGNWEKPESAFKFTLTSPELGDNGSAEIELKTVGADKFFKLNSIPMLGKLNLSALTNMWVKIEPKAGSTSVVPAATSTMSEETANAVKNIIRGGKYFQVTEDLGEESVGGNSTHHYKVTLNEAEVMRVAREVSEKVNGKAPSIEDEKKMTAFFDRAELSRGEIWVGSKDYYLYKVSFGLSIAKTATEPTSMIVGVELDLRNFNKAVTIEAPVGPKTMNEFMGSFIGAMMGSSALPTSMMGR